MKSTSTYMGIVTMTLLLSFITASSTSTKSDVGTSTTYASGVTSISTDSFTITADASGMTIIASGMTAISTDSSTSTSTTRASGMTAITTDSSTSTTLTRASGMTAISTDSSTSTSTTRASGMTAISTDSSTSTTLTRASGMTAISTDSSTSTTRASGMTTISTNSSTIVGETSKMATAGATTSHTNSTTTTWLPGKSTIYQNSSGAIIGETITSAVVSATARPTIPNTKLPPSRPTKEPVLNNVQFNMSFSFRLQNVNSSANLSDDTSSAYAELKRNVIKAIDDAFEGLEAYEKCIINTFRKTDAIKAQVLLDTTAQGGVDANYTVVFKPAEVLVDTTKLVKYIGNDASKSLTDSIIPFEGINCTVDNSDMINQLNSQSEKFGTKAICDTFGSSMCFPCYPCQPNKDGSGISCEMTCNMDEHQYCVVVNSSDKVTNNWKTDCSCEFQYLKFGAKCVHENVIIGVSAGVGGAILVALIVVVITLAFRKPPTVPSKLNENFEMSPFDREDKESEEVRNAQLDAGDITLTTFTVEQQSPAQTKVDTPQTTEDPPANIPEEVRQSVAFKDFVPQLRQVDHKNVYVLQRPKLTVSSNTTVL